MLFIHLLIWSLITNLKTIVLMQLNNKLTKLGQNMSQQIMIKSIMLEEQVQILCNRVNWLDGCQV